MSQDYAIDRVLRVIDGDTIRCHLTREAELTRGWAHSIHTTDPAGIALRLIIIDTPERTDPAYRRARDDLAHWLAQHTGQLRAELYAYAGWERELADIYVAGDRGQTASQHMLRLGWEPYLP